MKSDNSNLETQNKKFLELENLGFNVEYQTGFQGLNQPELVPARVTGKTRNSFHVMGEFGERIANISVSKYYKGTQNNFYPVVGDWAAVALKPSGHNCLIEAVLPRKSKIARQVSGGRDRYSGGATAEQVIAANVDLIFIVGSLDGSRNLNPNKIERYLALARASSASPVIILNKLDLCADAGAQIKAVQRIAASIPVLAVSATQTEGLERLKIHITRGSTAVFLGPSGVGKSSIINALLGNAHLKVGAVRESDFRGRHTTTAQELILIPGGGAVIDTPGIREIQLWVDEEELNGAFPDIELLARACRFRDCTHSSEPGCAVKQAIEAGTLEARRLENFRKLGKEVRYLEARQNDLVQVEEKKKWKKISQWQKDYNKHQR
jgi:ribosome biogenesis GTPase